MAGIIKTSHMADLGDAIRTKLDTTDEFTPVQMPAMISTIGSTFTTENSIINGSIVSLNSVNATKVPPYLCYYQQNLAYVNLPNVETVGTRSFSGCPILSNVNMPNVEWIGALAFNNCQSLRKIDFSKKVTLKESVFDYCQNLTTVIFRHMGLVSVTFGTHFSFSRTPIADGNGYIYVPEAYLDTYQNDESWEAYFNQLRAIEDYPEICGG